MSKKRDDLNQTLDALKTKRYTLNINIFKDT